MNRILIRKLLIGLGVLVLLAVAVLGYLVATFDANAYKGWAVDWMKTKHDRTLVISGPIKLSVFPRLAVQLSGVKLSEKGRADEFLSLQEASLSVAVLPLLRQQLVIDRISARGLHVALLRDAKGQGNLDDLAQPGSANEPAAQSHSALRFDVSSIQLEDLHLTLNDAQAKLAGEVTLNSLSTGRLADQVESPVKLDAQLALTSPKLQGQLKGETLLTLDLASKSVRLRHIALGWNGQVPGVEAAKVSLQGDLAYASKSLSLAQLRVKIAGTQSGHPLSLDLDWPQLAVKGESLSGSPLSGHVSVQGPTTFDAAFKTAAPSGSFERIRVPGFEATLQGRSGARQLSGTLRADLQLQAGQATLTLDALDAQLQVQEPSLKPLALTIKGKADADAQAAHWALNGQINSNPFNTEGSMILATTPLTLKVAARFDALDLNRLLPTGAAAAAAASAPAANNAGPAADTPVDLSPLRALQGQFNLRVGQFAYAAYHVSDAVFDATLEGGMLRVTQLAGKVWGGTLNATAFADARASRVAVNATAANVNVNALLKDVGKKDVLEGTGRVTLDVESAGRSVSELKSRLKGKASLQLRDGAIKGINLAQKLRTARATLGLKPADEKQKASQTEKTDFSELSASFVIDDGVARNADLDAKSPFLRLGGAGLVDIGKDRIDYTVRATVTANAKGQGGADLAALNGVTIPVQLTGPLEAIDWHIQWSAIATQVIKSEVGAQMKDQLKDRLRNALGLPGAASSSTDTNDETAAAKEKLKEKLKGLFK